MFLLERTKNVLFLNSLVIKLEISCIFKNCVKFSTLFYNANFQIPEGKESNLGWGCSLKLASPMQLKKIPISAFCHSGFLWYDNLVIRVVSQNIYCRKKKKEKIRKKCISIKNCQWHNICTFGKCCGWAHKLNLWKIIKISIYWMQNVLYLWNKENEEKQISTY